MNENSILIDKQTNKLAHFKHLKSWFCRCCNKKANNLSTDDLIRCVTRKKLMSTRFVSRLLKFSKFFHQKNFKKIQFKAFVDKVPGRSFVPWNFLSRKRKLIQFRFASKKLQEVFNLFFFCLSKNLKFNKQKNSSPYLGWKRKRENQA